MRGELFPLVVTLSNHVRGRSPFDTLRTSARAIHMCFQVRCPDPTMLRLMAAAMFLIALLPAMVPRADAQPLRLNGTLTSLQIDDPADRWSSGRIVVDTKTIVVPATVPIDLGESIETLQELFAYAPVACRRVHETGFVSTDVCRSQIDAHPMDKPPVTAVRVIAAPDAEGNLVASKVTFVPASAAVIRERARPNPLR
jgi:hypothetical protein